MEHITNESRHKLKKTEDYKIKKRELKKRIESKYSQLIKEEPIFIKKFILKLKKQQEFKKELRKLNPMESLFIKYV